MKIIKVIWQGFTNDYEVYINLLISITIAIFSINQETPINIVLSFILFSLSLISLSLLKNRKKDKRFQSLILGINNENSIINRAFQQDINHSEIATNIMCSKRSYISGMGHTILLPILKQLVEENPKECPEIRLLLMNPSGNAVKVAALRSRTDVKALRKTYKIHLKELDNLSNITNGKITYEILDYIPHCNIFGIDTNLPQGKIIVHFGSWRTSHAERPYIELMRNRDGKWFDYFEKQFNLMWNESKRVFE
ncbi:hypothetical protein KJ742_06555 [Patescibacteria group bacterium]|nr:hypothetical protein [Patescibacteria group bacterium]